MIISKNSNLLTASLLSYENCRLQSHWDMLYWGGGRWKLTMLDWVIHLFKPSLLLKRCFLHKALYLVGSLRNMYYYNFFWVNWSSHFCVCESWDQCHSVRIIKWFEVVVVMVNHFFISSITVFSLVNYKSVICSADVYTKENIHGSDQGYIKSAVWRSKRFMHMLPLF